MEQDGTSIFCGTLVLVIALFFQSLVIKNIIGLIKFITLQSPTTPKLDVNTKKGALKFLYPIVNK